MRKVVLSLAVVLVAARLCAEDITLPAAASIVGGAPFFSDVRAFNTSYAGALQVTARYRCFIPSPCTAVGAPQIQFALAPRESRAFDDMVAATFQAPNTAGGVEFEFSGASDQLVVTSRLYSTSPEPTVGMFIPGLKSSEQHSTTVLTSIRNGGPGQGFRSNVGVFNRENSAVNVTFTIFDAGVQVGSPVTRAVPGHSGVQVSGIFTAAGQAGHATDNAVVVVSATGEVFSYAAVIDNHTTDPIFVRGAEDQTASQAPVQRTVQVGQGGSIFVDEVSHGNATRIRLGDTVNWVWNGSVRHGVTSGTCSGGGGYYDDGTCDSNGVFSSGSHEGPHEFSRRFTQAGTFEYFCPVHGAPMRGRVIVEVGP